jgi:hypothetical protein
MLREATQDAELRAAVIRASLKLSEDERKPYRAILEELNARIARGSPMVLGDQELSDDWPSYVARLHRAAAELAGIRSDARWEDPPR